MHARFYPEDKKVRLEFETPEAAHAFLASAKESGDFIVKLEERLEVDHLYRFALRTPEKLLHSVEAKVKQVFRSGAEGLLGTVCRVTRWTADEAPADPSPAPDDPDSEAALAGSEMVGRSPVFDIQQMNVTQRMRLATRAQRTERQILLRDNSPQVMMGLLANPRVEDKEVLEIVKSSYAASGVLNRVASDRKWSTNYEIQLALVRNPKTPPLLALRLVEVLRTKDLQILAKSSHTREDVKKAALRVYLKRSETR